MSSNAPDTADWKTKVAFMRAEGLVSAKWASVPDRDTHQFVERLVEAVCGPVPVAPTEEEKIRETQPSISPQERQRRERLEKRRVAELSSGGPVRRLDADLG